jgi:cell division protein FtsL
MQWNTLKAWNKVKFKEAIKDGLDTKYYQWDKNLFSVIKKMFLTLAALIILMLVVEIILKIIA